MSATSSLLGAVADLLQQPTPGPSGGIDTNRIIGWLTRTIAPILLAILGVIFIGRAGRGEVSKVMTSSAIAIIGVAFIVGAGALFIFGESLVDLIFVE